MPRVKHSVASFACSVMSLTLLWPSGCSCLTTSLAPWPHISVYAVLSHSCPTHFAWPVPRPAGVLTGPCLTVPMLYWSVDPVVPALPCVRHPFHLSLAQLCLVRGSGILAAPASALSQFSAEVFSPRGCDMEWVSDLLAPYLRTPSLQLLGPFPQCLDWPSPRYLLTCRVAPLPSQSVDTVVPTLPCARAPWFFFLSPVVSWTLLWPFWLLPLTCASGFR